MSSFETNSFLEELGISPIKTDYVSPVTGEVIKRSAPTSLKDSYAIIGQNLQRYYDSKPKPVIEEYDDEDDFDFIISGNNRQVELTYVTTDEECKLKVESLLQYLDMMSKDFSPKTLFIERENTTITFGEIARNGERLVYGTMGISNDGVLRAIYELIRVRFSDGFKEQVTMGIGGWNLTPFISEETEVSISSNRLSDLEWIREENKSIQERKRQGKGLLI